MVDTLEFLPSEAELIFGEARATLRTYHELVAEALAKLPVDLTADEKADFRAQIHGDDPRLGNAMVEIHELFRRKAVEATVQFAHRSFILAVASATEEQARVFCDALQVPKGLTKRWKDIPGTKPMLSARSTFDVLLVRGKAMRSSSEHHPGPLSLLPRLRDIRTFCELEPILNISDKLGQFNVCSCHAGELSHHRRDGRDS